MTQFLKLNFDLLVLRQDPALAAGANLALMGMAFSAAFTGAVIAPVVNMAASRMVDVVSAMDISKAVVFPKDVFEDNYPDYADEYYEDEEQDDEVEDALEAEIIEAKKSSKKAKTKF